MDWEVISLDFYGTLVDVVSVYDRVSEKIISDAGLNLKPRVFSLMWRQSQRRHERRHPPPRYKDIIRLGLEDLSKKMGFKNNDYHLRLFDLWSKIEPYPEVGDVLTQLRKHYPIVVCSNSSRDLFEVCARKLPTSFDYSFLSDEVGAAKPNARLYQRVVDVFGVTPNAVFHVASSQMDVKGAHEFGYTNCWINRHHEQRWKETPKPGNEITTFNELTGILI